MPQSNVARLAFYWPPGSPIPALVRFMGRLEPDDRGASAVLLQAGEYRFQVDQEEVLLMTAQSCRLPVNLHHTPGHG